MYTIIILYGDMFREKSWSEDPGPIEEMNICDW
jgi:hypothetical protein